MSFASLSNKSKKTTLKPLPHYMIENINKAFEERKRLKEITTIEPEHFVSQEAKSGFQIAEDLLDNGRLYEDFAEAREKEAREKEAERIKEEFKKIREEYERQTEIDKRNAQIAREARKKEEIAREKERERIKAVYKAEKEASLERTTREAAKQRAARSSNYHRNIAVYGINSGNEGEQRRQEGEIEWMNHFSSK